MAGLKLEIVTAQRLVYSDDADMVLAPGFQGQVGILPNHTPLLTLLEPGQLVVRKGQGEMSFAIGGGFMEVLGGDVTVFADTAERADEIDLARAQEARRRAEQLMQRHVDTLEFADAHPCRPSKEPRSDTRPEAAVFTLARPWPRLGLPQGSPPQPAGRQASPRERPTSRSWASGAG